MGFLWSATQLHFAVGAISAHFRNDFDMQLKHGKAQRPLPKTHGFYRE